MTCRELDRSRRESVKRKKQKRKKKERGDKKKGKTIVDDERANSPCWLVAAIRKFLEISRFSRRVDTLFKIFSKFFVHGNVFTLPQPPTYDPPYTRSREKTESKNVLSSLSSSGKKNHFFNNESNSSINNLGENRLRVIRFFS